MHKASSGLQPYSVLLRGSVVSCGGEVSFWVTIAIETFVKATGVTLARHFAPKRWPAIGHARSPGRVRCTEFYEPPSPVRLPFT